MPKIDTTPLPLPDDVEATVTHLSAPQLLRLTRRLIRRITREEQLTQRPHGRDSELLCARKELTVLLADPDLTSDQRVSAAHVATYTRALDTYQQAAGHERSIALNGINIPAPRRPARARRRVP